MATIQASKSIIETPTSDVPLILHLITLREHLNS